MHHGYSNITTLYNVAYLATCMCIPICYSSCYYMYGNRYIIQSANIAKQTFDLAKFSCLYSIP